MKLHRRLFGSLALAATLLLAACAAPAPVVDTAARAALAPTGTLRVGVYAGSPSSMVKDPKSGEWVGVTYELGRELAQRLGVRVQFVEANRIALVVDGVKAGQIDFTFTNATEARARDVDFTAPLLQVELGYLVVPGSTVTNIADVDKPGVRIGVTQGSTSQGVLSRQFKNATVVPAASLKVAQEMLQQRSIDAFATNKGILFEMGDELRGARVLDGRWGVENFAIAIPKGREAGMPFLRQFAEEMRAKGRLQAMVERAGLRGTARAD